MSRLAWAWEVLTTGKLGFYEYLLERERARIKILEKYLNPPYGCVITPLGKTPEELPFPHTGPTRTPFDC